MFLKLFAKECGQMLKSLIYYLFLAAVVFFYVSQVGSFTPYSEPLKGQEESYGIKASSDKQQIMGATLALLAGEYEANSYTAYPVGFYKNVVLTKEKQEKIHQILMDCTGLEEGYTDAIRESSEEAPQTEDGSYIQIAGINPPLLPPAEDLSYDRFLRHMTKADKIIGGGTSYAADNVKNNAKTYATYEDAKKIYDASLYTDRISRGKARLFCDYMGIVLGLLPVFLAVTRTLRDKRSMAQEVIYARRASSVTIIAARYFSAMFLTIMPLFLLSLTPMLQCIYYGHQLGVSVDVLAFGKYILGWLLPETAFVLACGFFLSESVGGPAAILVQVVLWMVSISTGGTKLVGTVGWNLIPRFNNDQATDVWLFVFGQMVRNRLLYAGLALLFMAGTVFIYHMKRKGVLGGRGKNFIHRNRTL